jgi:hypothetical protein
VNEQQCLLGNFAVAINVHQNSDASPPMLSNNNDLFSTVIIRARDLPFLHTTIKESSNLIAIFSLFRPHACNKR